MKKESRNCELLQDYEKFVNPNVIIFWELEFKKVQILTGWVVTGWAKANNQAFLFSK